MARSGKKTTDQGKNKRAHFQPTTHDCNLCPKIPGGGRVLYIVSGSRGRQGAVYSRGRQGAVYSRGRQGAVYSF